jgi:hypothetical protein
VLRKLAVGMIIVFTYCGEEQVKNLLDRVRHDQGFMMYHICPNIRQLCIFGSSLFPTWIFRGGKTEKI